MMPVYLQECTEWLYSAESTTLFFVKIHIFSFFLEADFTEKEGKREGSRGRERKRQRDISHLVHFPNDYNGQN